MLLVGRHLPVPQLCYREAPTLQPCSHRVAAVWFGPVRAPNLDPDFRSGSQTFVDLNPSMKRTGPKGTQGFHQTHVGVHSGRVPRRVCSPRYKNSRKHEFLDDRKAKRCRAGTGAKGASRGMRQGGQG
jgi:hypothetical protein